MNTEMKKTVVYSTGDKILNIMKEQDMDIPELSLRCGVREDVLMDPGGRYKYALQDCRRAGDLCTGALP